MLKPDHPTIFALSSGRPPAAIAVVRISGPRAGEALKILTGTIPASRRATLARIRDPQTKEIIDQALALWFPAPHSETGEDVSELQLHGGRAVIAAVLHTLSKVEGLRPAEAGEFSRRAFENGKLDLTAAEGLADLVMAETEGQRRQALRQYGGVLYARAEDWRRQLIEALALVEACIDFSDEADVPKNLIVPALAIVRDLADEIAMALADDRRGERLREGLVVAIAGPPNAGKSTLINRIARREAAIVSPYAGTTRDVIEVHLDLDGWPVTMLDTAGIRETGDPVEMEGVRRARARAASADLVLWLFDARETGLGKAEDFTEAGKRVVNSLAGLAGFQGKAEDAAVPSPTIWCVANKIDLILKETERAEGQSMRCNESARRFNRPLCSMVNDRLKYRSESIFDLNEDLFTLSAVTGDGLNRLMSALVAYAEQTMAGADSALITRERQRHALNETLAALQRALAPDLVGREDLLAEEMRLAGRGIGRLIGQVDIEEILDVIFRDFCIGK